MSKGLVAIADLGPLGREVFRELGRRSLAGELAPDRFFAVVVEQDEGLEGLASALTREGPWAGPPVRAGEDEFVLAPGLRVRVVRERDALELPLNVVEPGACRVTCSEGTATTLASAVALAAEPLLACLQMSTPPRWCVVEAELPGDPVTDGTPDPERASKARTELCELVPELAGKLEVSVVGCGGREGLVRVAALIPAGSSLDDVRTALGDAAAPRRAPFRIATMLRDEDAYADPRPIVDLSRLHAAGPLVTVHARFSPRSLLAARLCDLACSAEGAS